MKAVIYIAIAAAMILLAVFLRFGTGIPLREVITAVIGAGPRAVIEHFLFAAGAPVMITLTIGLGGYLGDSALVKVGLKKPKSNLEILDQYLHGTIVFAATAVIAFLYVCVEYRFELFQEKVSVYGGSARGHFQWCQFLIGDLGGGVASALAAYIYKKTKFL